MAVTFTDRVARPDLAYGIVVVEPVAVATATATLQAALDQLVTQRRDDPLDAAEEQRRRAARDILRNGTYKPTGRGKPASEYLLRAAKDGQLPRINGPVDANNYISLRYLVPVSVWDLDRAGADHYCIRLGRGDERYVFNTAGQQLQLQDLVCGAAGEGDHSVPIVTPIKDGMKTKIAHDTRRIAGLIYFPMGDRETLEQITAEFAHLLAECGEVAEARWAVLLAGSTVSVGA